MRRHNLLRKFLRPCKTLKYKCITYWSVIIALILIRGRFFSRFDGILVWYRANLDYTLKSARQCVYYAKRLEGDETRACAWPTLVTYRPLPGAGDPTRVNRGRSRPGWSRDRLDIDFPRCVTDDKRDPVGLYSFTTLADADRNRSQTNRLVYAVMPIPGRRDGDWMFSGTAYSVKRPR